ncbi:hypothetical protein VHEMI06791 [[Torrubiella] hemipterigena]|uniref:Uncharacterized protein n=1 Tax=[Torrubiella] hemipterigena TaxID=1531966 RepID=A0A0A1TKA1_9HYPO|nr:hypothetical protein VHEMI06791 [[Torrubiella] hemipterigena]
MGAPPQYCPTAIMPCCRQPVDLEANTGCACPQSVNLPANTGCCCPQPVDVPANKGCYCPQSVDLPVANTTRRYRQPLDVQDNTTTPTNLDWTPRKIIFLSLTLLILLTIGITVSIHLVKKNY